MYQPNFERIARKIVHESLQVKAGEQGLITVRSDAVPYAELIAAEIYRAGGVATVLLESDELKFNEIMETPLEQLPLPWATTNAAIRAADFMLSIGLHEAEPDRFLNFPPEREQAFGQRRMKRSEAIYSEGGPRWLGTDYPTRYMGQSYNIPWGRLFEMFWRAMDVDYGLLRERAAALGERFDNAEQVRVLTPRGTDLRFHVGARQVFRDDGRISDIGNLPAGEVYFAPIEESVEGRVMLDLGFYQGQRLSGLELQFEGGVATPVGAEQGYELFVQQWESNSGDRDRVGEIGIGLNPEVPAPIGYELTDQKVLGALHLTLGENELTGGTNRGTLRWPLYLLQATVEVDGEPLLERGRFSQGLLR